MCLDRKRCKERFGGNWREAIEKLASLRIVGVRLEKSIRLPWEEAVKFLGGRHEFIWNDVLKVSIRAEDYGRRFR